MPGPLDTGMGPLDPQAPPVAPDDTKQQALAALAALSGHIPLFNPAGEPDPGTGSDPGLAPVVPGPSGFYSDSTGQLYDPMGGWGNFNPATGGASTGIVDGHFGPPPGRGLAEPGAQGAPTSQQASGSLPPPSASPAPPAPPPGAAPVAPAAPTPPMGKDGFPDRTPVLLPELSLADLPIPKTEEEAKHNQDLIAASAENAKENARRLAEAAALSKNDREMAAMQADVEERAKIDAEHEKAVIVAHTLAQQKTAEQVKQYDAAVAAKPDPAHYFSGEGGGLRRVMWGMAVALQAIGNMRNPGATNQALAMLERELNNDVDQQLKQQSIQIDRAKFGVAQQREENQYEESNVEARYRMVLQRQLSLAAYAKAKADAPGPLDAKAAAATLHAEFATKAMDTVAKMTEVATAKEVKKVDQAFDLKKQSREFGHSDAMQQRTFEQEDRMARERLGLGAQEYAAKKAIDEVEIDPQATGLSIRDRNGNLHPAVVADKETRLKIGADLDTMSRQSDAAARILARVDKVTKWSAVLGRDPELRGAILDYIMPQIKDASGKAFTKEEVKNHLATIGVAGFGGLGSVSDILGELGRGNFTADLSLLKRKMASQQTDAEAALKQRYNLKLNGGELNFRPPPRTAKLPDPLDADGFVGIHGGAVPGVDPLPMNATDARRGFNQAGEPIRQTAADSVINDKVMGLYGTTDMAHPEQGKILTVKGIAAAEPGMRRDVLRALEAAGDLTPESKTRAIQHLEVEIATAKLKSEETRADIVKSIAAKALLDMKLSHDGPPSTGEILDKVQGAMNVPAGEQSAIVREVRDAIDRLQGANEPITKPSQLPQRPAAPSKPVIVDDGVATGHRAGFQAAP